MFSSLRIASCATFGRPNHHSYLRGLLILHPDFKGRCQISNISTEWNIQTINTSQAPKVSHMFNRGESPLLEKTIGQVLSEAAAEWPERIGVVSVHQDTRLTFSDLLRRVDAFAAGLKKLGMKKGDRIGIWGPNDLEWYITSMAAARAGLIVVAINPAYQQSELMYSLQKVGAKMVVSPDVFKRQNYAKMLLKAKETYPVLEHIIIYSGDHVTGTHRFTNVEASATRIEVEAISATQDEISCYDGCNIQFTSGSTGTAKATLISHKSIVNNSKEASRRAKLNNENKICMNVPFFHAFGLIMGPMFTFHTGSTVILEERSFNPIKSLQTIVKEKCTMTYGTPTMWVGLLNAQQRLNLPTGHLQLGCVGGADCPPELFKRIGESLRCEMMTIYGLTETTGVIFQSIQGQHAYLTENTVGYLANHVEAMVVDENGIPVPFETPGELWIRGYCNMMHYWDGEEFTKKTITQDGWLKTGDQFVLSESGYGSVVGRFKDMVIRGGENIFPKEIENFLMSHPDIMESHIIGVYDELYGEELCACILLRDGAKMTKDELKEYCKDKIAHFKIPRYIEFVDKYPKTTSGKIQKFRLREEMENRGLVPVNPRSRG